MTLQKDVIVTGATNQVAYYLIPALLKETYNVHAISRQYRPDWVGGHSNLHWIVQDLSVDQNSLPNCDVLIYSAPIEYAANLIKKLISKRFNRVILISSSSAYSKVNSSSLDERLLANRLIEGELNVRRVCQQYNIDLTLFRPTLIYGCGLDENLSKIAAVIKRLGFVVLPGWASGLRQPVHADDVAKACRLVLNKRSSFNKLYYLTGGETVSYYEMVRKVFSSMRRSPRILRLPKSCIFPLIFLLKYTRYNTQLNREMLIRINQDLCFDCKPAAIDFDYLPRLFEPSNICWNKPSVGFKS